MAWLVRAFSVPPSARRDPPPVSKGPWLRVSGPLTGFSVDYALSFADGRLDGAGMGPPCPQRIRACSQRLRDIDRIRGPWLSRRASSGSSHAQPVLASQILRSHGGARWNQLRVEAAVLAPRDHGRTVHDGMRPGQEEGSHPRPAVATIMKPGCDAGITR
jgi:hypothetical protein